MISQKWIEHLVIMQRLLFTIEFMSKNVLQFFKIIFFVFVLDLLTRPTLPCFQHGRATCLTCGQREREREKKERERGRGMLRMLTILGVSFWAEFFGGSETLEAQGRNICRKMCPKNVPQEFAEKHVGNVLNLLEQSKHSHQIRSAEPWDQHMTESRLRRHESSYHSFDSRLHWQFCDRMCIRTGSMQTTTSERFSWGQIERSVNSNKSISNSSDKLSHNGFLVLRFGFRGHLEISRDSLSFEGQVYSFTSTASQSSVVNTRVCDRMADRERDIYILTLYIYI